MKEKNLRIAERALRRNDETGTLNPTLRQRLAAFVRRWWRWYWRTDDE